MRWARLLLLKTLAAGVLGCGCQPTSPPPAPALPPGASLIEARNGKIPPLTLEFQQEDPDQPRLKLLREREGLDQVVAGAKDELEVFTRLCDWTNAQWQNSTPNPYPPWDALFILDWIRAGKTGGFCAQYAVVLVQAGLSLGYSARYLAVAPEKGEDSGHLTVEVWSNQYDKWVVIDPFFNARYEREGLPLSGLEVHQALVQGKAKQVRVIRGQGGNGEKNSKASEQEMIGYYFHLAADLRNNHLSRPLPFWDRRQGYLSWQDSFTQGRPRIFGRFTRDPEAFNFPLNQVEAEFEPAGPARLRVRLRTAMVKFQEFEVQPDPGSARRLRLEDPLIGLDPLQGSVLVYEWPLKPGENTLTVRSRNAQGISGPAAFLRISFQP